MPKASKAADMTRQARVFDGVCNARHDRSSILVSSPGFDVTTAQAVCAESNGICAAFLRLFTRRIWLLRPPLTATAGPAGSLVSRRGYGAVLHQDAAVAGARRPDANSVTVFHHDDVENDVLIAR